jgi:hypothetical protein
VLPTTRRQSLRDLAMLFSFAAHRFSSCNRRAWTARKPFLDCCVRLLRLGASAFRPHEGIEMKQGNVPRGGRLAQGALERPK